jgi:drug/metabolite transporter (DMT)-like permease
MTRWRADGLLLATALIFGLAFLAQKGAHIGPLAFVAGRFLLSALVLAPLAVLESRRTTVALDRRDWLVALSIGLALFIGGALQQIGMTTATATNGGFLTALYVVLTPFVVWMLTGRRPAWLVFLACALSIIGAWALATDGRALVFAPADTMLLVADVGWALLIALTSFFLARTPRPFMLAFTQSAVCVVLGIASAAIFEVTTLAGLQATALALGYAGIVAGGLGFTIQLLALGHTPPSEAALILSLEGVFAALAGAWQLGERLSPIAILGCLLITLGVVIVEAAPTLRIGRLKAIQSPRAKAKEAQRSP